VAKAFKAKIKKKERANFLEFQAQMYVPPRRRTSKILLVSGPKFNTISLITSPTVFPCTAVARVLGTVAENIWIKKAARTLHTAISAAVIAKRKSDRYQQLFGELDASG
jgi:hypothetical protein